MDINQLRYFIEICKLGSMSKAAVSLNISPQGISAAIRRLEDELMADLFYRSANGLELTNLGKSVYSEALIIVEHVDKIYNFGKLEAMDGQVWLDEREDVYCVWRTEYSRRSRLLDYYVDIFSARADGAWERSFEEHHQRWYSVSELTEWLTAAGFGEIRVYGDCRLRAPNETDGRIYISCIRKE